MFSTESTEQIFNKILHYIVALMALLNIMYIQAVSAFRFIMPEQRVKVDFDVRRNDQKLIGYYSNVPWATTKLMTVL